MSRRGRVMETGREVVWCSKATEVVVVAEQAVPHSCVVDKDREEYFGSE